MITIALEITRGYPRTTTHVDILDKCGLSKLAYVGSIKLDLNLITILVEKWDQDCCTFHLPMGKMSVTLFDIYHI